MINVLQADPALRDRYDFWAFSYDTGNPIVYSSMILRDALTSAVKLLDPEGKDPGLQQMVVIGHSQGGLLTKMTVVNTGSRLYDAAFKKPIDQLNISDGDAGHRAPDDVRGAAALRQAGDLHLAPRTAGATWRRAGSSEASCARLVSMPARLVKGTAELLANRDAFAVERKGEPHAHGGGQHVPAEPVHQDAVDHPHRPRGRRPTPSSPSRATARSRRATTASSSTRARTSTA